MFGLGSREAVVRALAGDDAARAGFGAPATADEVADAVTAVTGVRPRPDGDGLVAEGSLEVLRALALAHGWRAAHAERTGGARLTPASP
jgi:coenzyme F420-0:L-glutamate ligase/coenzyme F420-1:gamma-L-glutamate ligase